MKLLSIDSTGKTAAAAVTEEGRLLGEGFCDEGLTHSQTLLPLVDETLKQAGLTIKDIDAFAVTNGPGSFTGLRIGCGLAKGLALGRPCIAVPTLMALAFNEAESERTVVSLLDARCRQVYMGGYSFEEGVPRSILPDQACSAEEAAAQIKALGKPTVLLGDGAYLLEDLVDGEQIILSSHHHILGHSIAKAAAFLEKKPPEQLVPAYFRLSQAEREYQMRKEQQK
ncbi:MAG: tRNA (adenosine(37)-N6)-threonylcarbamoyltransferase complex dimerization subunit type 1 TsaB [Clostridia bacterium]|nr:tRNA (adenosine(37)-N6)-threonylcarbamoyltransferase complex dimerization subunit type 1 TsaB [Clostridia bacterium]